MKPALTESAIRQAAKDPEALATLLFDYRLSDKHHRQRDEEYREVLARAYMTLTVVGAMPGSSQLLADLKKAVGCGGSSDSATVILKTFIDYTGLDQRQYLSRDKAVLNFLGKQKVAPNQAAAHIKDAGGLQSCAKAYRAICRGEAGDLKPKTSDTLAGLVPGKLGQEGDLVVVVARLEAVKGKRFKILRSEKLPPALSDKARRKVFWAAIMAELPKDAGDE